MRQIDNDEYWKAARRSFSDRILDLTILPTEQCNLRCAYCYESFKLGKMSRNVISAIKKHISIRAPNLHRINVSWFGGEPLLATDVIEDIGAYISALTTAHPNLTYRASVTTNGVLLTPKIGQRLANVGVNFAHVSLDGPRAIHDQTRSARGGQGTFDRIVRNLFGILNSDLKLGVKFRVHVTSANCAELEGFIDYLGECFLEDPRFGAYLFPIVDLGGPNQGNFPSILDQALASAIVDRLSKKIARNPRWARFDYEEPKSTGCYVCYAARANAWVIRSNGHLSKCTVGFEDERNHVGRITDDGKLQIFPDRHKTWLRGWETGKAIDLHCPYEGMRNDVQSGLVPSRDQ